MSQSCLSGPASPIEEQIEETETNSLTVADQTSDLRLQTTENMENNNDLSMDDLIALLRYNKVDKRYNYCLSF